MPMLTTLILFAVFSPSSSAPLTSTLKPIWRRESCSDVDAQDVRTVQDIVWSCVATIFACAWVALHPNLPDPHSSGWSQFKHRTRVVIVAVIAPEFILVWALRQRIAAGNIVREYNRIVLEIDEEQKSLICRVREWFHVQPQRNNGPRWTLTHGFYVQMGGFLLYNKDTPLRVLPVGQLLTLIRSGLVDRPNVTEEDIRDRSKGDFFTKAFVVAQTTWFIAQCTARWASRLAVTELEVTTLAFAFLNIITYSLWWEKPQNVTIGVRVQLKEGEMVRRGLNTDGREDPGKEDPIYRHHSVDGLGGQNTGAREEMDVTDSSRGEGQQDVRTTLTQPDKEGTDFTIRSRRISDSQDTATPDAWPSIDGMDVTDSGRNVRAFEGDFNPIVAEHTVGQPDITNHPIVTHDSPSGQKTNENHHETQSNLGTEAIAHPRGVGCLAFISILSVPGWSLYPKMVAVMAGPYQASKQCQTTSTIELILSSPYSLNIGTFYVDNTPASRGLRFLISSAACGTLFGGLHLIPWRFVFPTHSEFLLWHIAALYITLNPVILFIPYFLLFSYFSRSIGSYRMLRFIWGLMPLFGLIIGAFPLYILARIVIIVLVFTTLRSLPPDALREIPWGSFIPHI